MGDSSLFFILSGASALLISVWIVTNRSDAASRASARAFYWISIAFSISALMWITSDALGWLPADSTSRWWFRILTYRAWLVIGTAVSCAVLLILGNNAEERVAVANNAARTFLTSPCVLKGISLSVSMSFISTEIGKLTHDAEMRQFFLQSGYPVWFLYFIIMAEIVGAVGLLVPRTASVAALSLSGLMIGAVGTHLHNRDPLSDSLEALHLLVILGCILVIRLQQGNRRQQWKSAPS